MLTKTIYKLKGATVTTKSTHLDLPTLLIVQRTIPLSVVVTYAFFTYNL